MRERDAPEKSKKKTCGDKNARPDDVKVGDTVLIRKAHNKRLHMNRRQIK